MPTRLRNRDRRGNYAILLALSLAVPLGFGALAVDTSYVRLSQAQLQDVADAASQSALFALRRTGDPAEARAAAQAVVDRNPVGGYGATLSEVAFGLWEEGAFAEDPEEPNAVQVRVERSGDNALGLFLARALGYESVDIAAEATSAVPTLHVVLVMDINPLWYWDDFRDARDAAVVFYDNVANAHGVNDRIGMVTFLNVYGYEQTPLMLVDDSLDLNARAGWASLGLASVAGARDDRYAEPYRGHPCRYNVFRAPGHADDFNWPRPEGIGGCFPLMPRMYTDELGTDHSAGLAMAERMFQEHHDPGVYRAMIVLTSGEALGPFAGSGAARARDKYGERRWRYYKGPLNSTSQVQRETVRVASRMWDEQRVNTWFVSFNAEEPWQRDVPRGDGYFLAAADSADIIEVFDEISNALPMTLVR